MSAFSAPIPVGDNQVEVLNLSRLKEVEDIWLGGRLSSELETQLFVDNLPFSPFVKLSEGDVSQSFRDILPRDRNYPALLLDSKLSLKANRNLIEGESLFTAGFTSEPKKANSQTTSTSSLQPGSIISGFFDIPASTSLIAKQRDNIFDYYYVPLGYSIGSEGSAADVANNITEFLFKTAWNFANVIPGWSMISKSTSAKEDWDSNRLINVPSFSGRTLTNAGGSSNLGKLVGASQQTLSLNNMPPHDHGGGVHDHSGKAGIIDLYPAPGYNSSIFTRPQTSYTTGFQAATNMGWSHLGGINLRHEHILYINNSGKIITTEGGGQPFSIKELSINVNQLIYLGSKGSNDADY